MGNSSSTNVFLSVNESRTAVTAGSIITGEIRCPDHSISNSHSMPTDVYSLDRSFSGVTLYFIGKEDVEVRYKDSNSSGGCNTSSSNSNSQGGGGFKSEYAKRDFVRIKIPIDTSHSCVETGRYPFSFRVPDHLPSSMRYNDGNGGYCLIRYKVKLHLLRGTDQDVPIEIIAKPPSTSTPVPSLADPMLTRIQFLYCIPQGSMTWAAGVDNTRVQIGETLNLNLGMKNESLVKLQRVTAKLKQTVEWHTPGYSSTNKSIIHSSSFGKTVSMRPKSKDQLKLMKSSTRSKKKSSNRYGPVGHQTAEPITVYEEVLDTAQVGANQVTFPIPEYVQQSYNGRLMKIRHYVTIKAKTPSCYTSPSIHIPIEIGPSQSNEIGICNESGTTIGGTDSTQYTSGSLPPSDTPIVMAVPLPNPIPVPSMQPLPTPIPVPSAPTMQSYHHMSGSLSESYASAPPSSASTTFVVGSFMNEGSGQEEFVLDSVQSSSKSSPASIPVSINDDHAVEETTRARPRAPRTVNIMDLHAEETSTLEMPRAPFAMPPPLPPPPSLYDARRRVAREPLLEMSPPPQSAAEFDPNLIEPLLLDAHREQDSFDFQRI